MRIKILLPILLLTNTFLAHGQIIYTDYIPDIYLTNQPDGTYQASAIDIDQDAVADFTAYCYSFFMSVHQGCCWNKDNGIQINPSQISFAFVNDQNTCGHIPLDSNIWIDSSFYYPTTFTTAYFYRDGNISQCGWLLSTNPKFYSFRKTVNNDTLYGWIRIEAHPTFMIIYDAAINTVSNVGLYSGQTVAGIPEHLTQNSLQVIPTVTSDHIQIINHSLKKENVSIVNSLGQVESNFDVSPNETYSIDISTFNRGIYFVRSSLTNNGTKILKL